MPKWTLIDMNFLRRQYGDMCGQCGSRKKLEFAHIMPTGLRGASRGRHERFTDIKNHPLHYCLLCHECHMEYDDENPNRTSKKQGGGGKNYHYEPREH